MTGTIGKTYLKRRVSRCAAPLLIYTIIFILMLEKLCHGLKCTGYGLGRISWGAMIGYWLGGNIPCLCWQDLRQVYLVVDLVTEAQQMFQV